MTRRKITITTDKLENLLKRDFKNVKILNEFTENENARAFLFKGDENEFIIKVDSNNEDFIKDKYAFEHFSTDRVIIPEVINQGKFEDGLFYSISKKLDGKSLDTINLNEINKIISNLGLILKDIHESNISDTFGYGAWGNDGNAIHKTWRDAVLGIRKSQYFNWDKLFNEGIYEKDLFDKVYGVIVDLSIYGSEERSLVHGDFGHNNLLIKDGEIAGVLDWGLSKYGDFIYDISYLSFWEKRIDFGKVLKENYSDMNIDNYDERLLCYKLHTGLSSSGFTAKWGQKKQYNEIKKILLGLLY